MWLLIFILVCILNILSSWFILSSYFCPVQNALSEFSWKSYVLLLISLNPAGKIITHVVFMCHVYFYIYIAYHIFLFSLFFSLGFGLILVILLHADCSRHEVSIEFLLLCFYSKFCPYLDASSFPSFHSDYASFSWFTFSLKPSLTNVWWQF